MMMGSSGGLEAAKEEVYLSELLQSLYSHYAVKTTLATKLKRWGFQCVQEIHSGTSSIKPVYD